MKKIFMILMLTCTVASAGPLVVVSWGGAYTSSQQNAYHNPYMERNPHVRIINDDSAAEGASKLRAQVEAGNVTWDVVDVVPSSAISLCDEGLVEEIDVEKDLAPGADGSTATEDFGESLISPCFIPQIVYSTTFGYRSDLLYPPPKTIADVFNLSKFPGKRALEKNPAGNLEWALVADGVPTEYVYIVLDSEEGIDKAFAKLDTIKDKVIWWTKGAQPGQWLADGEVTIASAYNGRLFSAIEEHDQPIAMLWDAQVFELDGWVIPKGAPNRAEAFKFVKFATDTQRLADQAKYISYGPARKSSAALVGDHAELGIDMRPHMPTHPDNAKNVIYKNVIWWADHKDELSERFEAWLTK